MSQKAFGAALGDMQVLTAGMGSNGRIRRRGLRLDGVYTRAAGRSGSPGGPEGSESSSPFGPTWEPER